MKFRPGSRFEIQPGHGRYPPGLTHGRAQSTGGRTRKGTPKEMSARPRTCFSTFNKIFNRMRVSDTGG
jgi:hypothetical protein